MNFGQRLKTAINSFSKTSNSFTGSNDFLKNGNRNKMTSDWTSVSMSDEDFYTGYSYAAINNRANKTSQVAMKYLKTIANKAILDSYKKKEETLVHPYLTLIEDSVEYSEYDFWYDISTYLDLEGISYILVTRTVEGDRVGTAQEFEVLNPYEIRRIRDKNTLDIGGYVETRDGMVREISPKQMIEIRKLNPFSRDSSFAMTDAAKDSQFTLKQAGDYTRHSLKNNQSAPGIISTDVMLEPEQFKNFVSRITNQDKGMPIFGNGSGAVTWDSMQVDLDKASLNSINEINRSTLFAVSGMSKTSMGIEESGTTRDVSKTQTDNLIENHIMPQIQKVIDALNLDYKKYSPKEYANDKMLIVLDNPLGKDKDVESKEVTIAGDKIKLRQDLIALGYTIELASKYANGEIELDELGLPTEEVKQIEAKTKEEPKPKVDDSKKEDKQAVEDAKAENAYLKELISFLVQKCKNQAKVLTVDRPIVFENQIASRDYPELYNDININPDDLGCIMLNTEPIYVTKYIKDGARDLVESTNRHDHTMGAVSEVESHLTLLYGLLENGNKWKSKVDSLLKGWKINSVTIQEISYFDLEESYAIIAKIKKTDNLLDGHNRLTLLPHINTFSDYDPHITLAYINKDVNPKKWTKPLSTIYNGKTIKTTSINYGDKESSKKSNNAIQDSLPIINQVNIIEDQQNALKSTINKIQADIIKNVITRVTKNAFDKQDDIILTSDREESESDLKKQLVIFYTALFLIYGPQLFNKRKSEFEDVKSSKFILTPTVKSTIDDFASKASKSHVDTILNDLLDTSNMAYEKSVETEVARLLKESGKKEADKAMYDLARKKALEGEGRVQIISAIKKEYQDISTTRANTIARTETQRAFNQSQYQADVQFLNDNDLMGRAYKQWKTRSAEPCQYCIDLSKEPPIPFDNNFRDLGDELSYIYTKKDGSKVKRSLQVDYEELSAGNAHVNCVLPDTNVIAPDTENVIKSYYSGNIVKISTASGSKLSVTPNHIVLTSRGWVAAKNLVKSDSVVSYSAGTELSSIGINPANNHSPTTIEQIFTSLSETSGSTLTSVPATAKDFKGDGVFSQGNIDIIPTNSFLSNNITPELDELIVNQKLDIRVGTSINSSSLIKSGNLSSMLFGLALSSDGIISSKSLSFLLSNTDLTAEQFAGLFDGSSYNTRLNQAINDDIPRNTESLTNTILGLSSYITFDSIIDIEFSSYSGHVYDLSTKSTLYISNNIITSNCNCVYSLIIKDGSGNFVQSFDINIDEFGKIENYNKNHGDGGRFSSGIGGLTSSQIDKYSAMAYENGSDFYRSEFMERVTKDLKYDGKPGIASSVPKGTKVQYRGWHDKAHVDSYKNSPDPRLSIGIFGSGLYFTSNIEMASSYTGSANIITGAFVNKKAKVADAIKLRDEMFAASDKLSTRQNKERVALKDIKGKIPRVEAKVKLTQKHNNENKLFTDLGAYAAIKGYDVIQAPGEIVVLNRSMITFVEEK